MRKNELKIGDKITLKQGAANNILLRESENIKDLNRLRAAATIRGNKVYKIDDRCPPCHKIWIKVRGYNFQLSYDDFKI